MFSYTGIMERLRELDQLLASVSTDGDKVELVIVGGSALIVNGFLPGTRSTVDIDVISAGESAYMFFGMLDMNDDVNTFLYQLPSHWESRKLYIAGEWEVLSPSTPAPVDLAIMKLASGRKTDIQDVAGMLSSGSVRADEIQALLDDPLEVAVNLGSDTWTSVVSRAESLGISSSGAEGGGR